MDFAPTTRCVALALFVCSATVLAQAPPLEKPDVLLATERVSEVANASGLAGEIVISDRDGATTDTVFGLADREKNRPHIKGQQWLWASVTKQITAMLVMQEVDRGTLALDDPIGKHLAAFFGNPAITLRELLQHRSGLPNPSDGAGETDVPAFYRETGAGISNLARATGFCSGLAKGAVGGDFEYNNCDYLVLGAMLEKVTGKSYNALVAERVAEPLGLGSLRVAADGAVNGGASYGGYDGAAVYPALNVATFGAAGALTGSAEDLVAVDRAFLTGRFLSESALSELWEGNPELGYQALGVWSFPAKLAGCSTPVTLVERRGDVGGTQVRNIIAPDLSRSVGVFTNDAALEFGEVWQGAGLTHDLLSAAFCAPAEPGPGNAPMEAVVAPASGDLIGAWTVDLRPTPDAAAYLKPMVIAIDAAGALSGEFYERPIESGHAGATNGQPCFAFRTSDMSGPYQTSGCLSGTTIVGQTWSEGRGFVLTWTAERQAADNPNPQGR